MLNLRWSLGLVASLALLVMPAARAGDCITRQSVVSMGAGQIGWAHGGADDGNAIVIRTADGVYYSMDNAFNANDDAGRFLQDALLLVLVNGMRINAWDHVNPGCSALDEIEIIRD
jgi:hypothetical protein